MTYNSARAKFNDLRAALRNKKSLPWNIGNEILCLVGPKSGIGEKDGSHSKIEEIAIDLAPDFPQYTVVALAKLRNTTQGFPDGIPDGVSWASCESAGTAERLNLVLSRLGNKPPLRKHVRNELKAIDTVAREEKRIEKVRNAETMVQEVSAILATCSDQKQFAKVEKRRAKAVKVLEAAETSKSRGPATVNDRGCRSRHRNCFRD